LEHCAHVEVGVDVGEDDDASGVLLALAVLSTLGSVESAMSGNCTQDHSRFFEV
jgi:hypothetical protein